MKNNRLKNFLLILVLLLFSFNVSALAAIKNDCSQYNSKTFMGMLDIKRCEQGKPPRKKWNLGTKLKKLNPLK